ncbi:ricin-type beta-trefoil lectin domain protein [Micromonospora narathiwatensis]|uniref:Streptogrisin C. Serine peptidase. MEROPS family S01A n=1 Tax=Micromonospora narathiwatensis TaxID=299146 RepID=A0A1A8ZQC0_9ACTN|nr:ricin-type beta-trefoil lectin domain protein [Micromonospora narathiwatensis]SBT46059.1 streptogrisin C. Serine peptidase. MEROPS family S01A [Micromonospora narathiwatensis]
MNKLLGLLTSGVLAAGLTAPPAQAAPESGAAGPAPGAATGLAPGMADAMRRDLGLTDRQIADRLRVEAAASSIDRRLRARLGTRYAGSWLTDGQRLTVAVTDGSAAATVRAEGAEPRLVAHSLATLTAASATLDRYATRHRPADAVRGWYADAVDNSVVVLVEPGRTATARSFVAASGTPDALVRYVAEPETPRPVYDIRGGDQFVINGNVLCSVGFAVAGGFVTAGHCGGTGSWTLGYNNASQGTFAGSSFPGNDYAWVRTNGDWTPRPWVNNYAGGNAPVAGSADAVIGSSVCRSGRTTGWRCGTLLGRNETVNYAQGAVYGLSRSNACAEPGDSGGAWLSGDQAQGVTSGGTGNCSTGGTMWFQPVNPILGAYGLSLVTTGGGGGTRLISNWNNRCVDVPYSNFSDGVPLWTWTCNGTSAQSWTFTGGTLRTQNNMCMDVAWGSRDNGAVIQIASCSGNPAQQFVLTAAGDLVNPQANKCVDIKDWNNSDGARLQLWDCAGTANQKWRTG